MRPDKQKQMMAYLTRPARELIEKGQVQFASDMAGPEPKQAIREINLFNEFNVRNPKAKGGRIGYNVGTLVGYGTKIPGVKPLLKKGAEALGGTAIGKRVYDTFFSDVQDTGDGTVIAPDANEMEKEAKRIREMTKPIGFPGEIISEPIRTGETTPPKIETKEEFPAETKQLPNIEGFPAETQQLPIIFENRKQESPKKRGQKKIEELNPDTVSEVKNIINDYRAQKTNPGKTQPTMTMGDKTELLNLVLDKFQEKENRVPIYSEVVGLMPQISNLNEVIQYGQIELPKGKADFDRTDPQYVELMQNKTQEKATNKNTISIYSKKNYYPETITLKNGDVVNAEKFFIDNLIKKTELGPGREEAKALTLSNKELASLYNTTIRTIEKANNNVRNSPDFQADYPPKRAANYGNIQAAKTLNDAREYAKTLPNGELHVKNVLIQERKRIPDLNNLFKNEILKITDYPKIVEDLNTTMDKETGIIDKTITKTEKEMTERAKRDKGLFQVFHNVPKSSKQKNIEFLSNRYLSLYKTNVGFVKSAEAYIKNKKDNIDYKERVEDFDNYLKERGLRIKIDNKFYGIDFQEMINSETGEFTGINRTLDYYGLPKFENGVPLTKVKKADGGSMNIDLSFFAGGGIAKEAGDSSGPPPERGPNPQGLLSLMKRVKNI